MNNIVRFPGKDGGGPEDPMLERVERLEKQMDRVEGKLSSIELMLAEIKGQLSQMPKAADLAAIRSEVGELKGRINALPTWWMLVGAMIATWGAGAAIVRFLVK
jgi:hypothetical protein